MNDIPCREGILDSASCPSCPLRRRPSMMKRLRSSFRRAISNKEVLASESKMVLRCLAAQLKRRDASFTGGVSLKSRAGVVTAIDWHSVLLRCGIIWCPYLETNVKPWGRGDAPCECTATAFLDTKLWTACTDTSLRVCRDSANRDQVAILCHRFLVLGIIEDAKCIPEADKDFNTGLLYRLTAQKKFWELASLKSDDDEESDGQCKEEPPAVTLTCLADDCKKAAQEEISDKCSKNKRT